MKSEFIDPSKSACNHTHANTCINYTHPYLYAICASEYACIQPTQLDINTSFHDILSPMMLFFKLV